MIPRKLKDDAILEALCQLHFTAEGVPEVTMGRLTDFPDSGQYKQEALPVANIPAPMRRQDPQLRFQPLVRFKHDDGRTVQVGEMVVSAHVVGMRRYPGWDKGFRAHVAGVVNHLFKKVPSVKVQTLMLRYINALIPERHFVDGPRGLNLELSIAGETVLGPINLNMSDRNPAQNLNVTTRIADVSFVQGGLPPGAKLVIDVEVSSLESTPLTSEQAVLDWFDRAHTKEKEAFFRLLPKDVIEKLQET